MFTQTFVSTILLLAAGVATHGPQRVWASPPLVAVHREHFMETDRMNSKKLRLCEDEIQAWYLSRLVNDDLFSLEELSDAKVIQAWYHTGMLGIPSGPWAVPSSSVRPLLEKLKALRAKARLSGRKGFKTLEDYIASRPPTEQAIIKFWLGHSEACKDKTGQWKARVRTSVVASLRLAKLIPEDQDPMPLVKEVVRAIESWQNRR